MVPLIQESDYTEPYEGELLYHCVWFGAPLDHHVLSITSLLSTQKNPRVILWTDSASYAGLKRLETTHFTGKPVEVRDGTSILRELRSYQALSFRSDMWRVQILHLYGGVYFDLDILFLKDISWVVTYGKGITQEGFRSESVFNTALLYYPQGNVGLLRWIERITSGSSLNWGNLFQIQSYSNLDTYELDLLPNDVTDRCWTGREPGADAFFEKPLDPSCLDGCIVYHWHNRWNKSVRTPGTLVNHYWNLFGCTPV